MFNKIYIVYLQLVWPSSSVHVAAQWFPYRQVVPLPTRCHPLTPSSLHLHSVRSPQGQSSGILRAAWSPAGALPSCFADSSSIRSMSLLKSEKHLVSFDYYWAFLSKRGLCASGFASGGFEINTGAGSGAGPGPVSGPTFPAPRRLAPNLHHIHLVWKYIFAE